MIDVDEIAGSSNVTYIILSKNVRNQLRTEGVQIYINGINSALRANDHEPNRSRAISGCPPDAAAYLIRNAPAR